MSKRKFNLGEIIRKLNEDAPNVESSAADSSNVLKNVPDLRDSHIKKPINTTKPTSSLPHQPDFQTGLYRNCTSSSAEKTPHNTAPPGSVKSDATPLSGRATENHSYKEEPSPHHQYPRNPKQDTPSPPAGPSSATVTDDDEEEETFDFYKYIGILLRRKYIILIVILLSTLFSLFRYIQSDTYYISSARLLFKPDQAGMINTQNMGYRYWGEREKVFSTHLELLKSRTVLAIVSQNLDNSIPVEAIAGGLTIRQGETNGEKNDIIEIAFRHRNAEIARDVLNELCRSYIEYRRDVNAQEVTRLIRKFEYQIDKIENDLNKRENALREFKESHRMVELSNETNLTISKLSNMEMALQQTQLELLENKERLGALTTQISKQEQDIIQSVTYQDPFKNKISDLELELSTLTTEYSPEHFKVKTLRQQIENLKSATVDSLTKKAASKTLVKNPIRQMLLQKLINATIEKSSLDAKRTAQEQMIDRLNQELIKLPALEQQFANLQRETESLLQTLRMLKGKFEETKIRKDSEESDLKLLELARTPQAPISSSNATSIVIGILLGFILGIALALLIEYLDQSLKDPSSVERELGLPLLGIVPFIEADHALLQKASDITKNILEPFRALRANIKHIASVNNLQTFIVCSAIKGEGKTTLGANLALTFAMDGKRVILVDGDLRRSQVHTLFGIEKHTGLSDYLLDTKTVDEIIKPTKIDNMFLITSGERPHNPAELLGTIRFDQIIDELRQRADIIIFDSPALLPVSDTITMAPKMDGVLFVVRTFWTPLKAAKQALNQLERIGSKLYGGILNGASHSGKNYPYYYGYYGYYGYYSYKYSYEDDQPRKLSLRTIGLGIEQKIKDITLSFVLGIPKSIGVISKETSKLTRKKRFWVLFILLIALVAIRVYLQHTHQYTIIKPVEYVGISSPSQDKDLSNVPVNDMAFTGTPSTATDNDTTGLHQAIKEWYQTLSRRDIDAYIDWYDKQSFRYTGGGITQWEAHATQLFKSNSVYTYQPFSSFRILNKTPHHVELMITYELLKSQVPFNRRIVMVWMKKNDTWRITEEKVVFETSSGIKEE